MIQLTSLMMAWLGVASLGFSFQSFHWFEIHNLGDPLNPYNHTLPSLNTTILQVRAHVGLWGACIVPEEDPLTPSPSNIPGPNPGPNDGPMCKSFQTTNHFLNVSAQTSNGNFEKYLLFPRSFMYLSLLFSIFGAVICSLLISGVGTTTLLDELRHRRYEEPQQLLDAAGELKQKKGWQNYSYYITCLCQAFFVLLGTGSAYLAIDTQRLVSHHTAINYYPVQITSKVVSSNAFFPALIGGITPLLSAFTWWCSQLISERSEGRSKQLTAPIARDGRREGGGMQYLSTLEILLLHNMNEEEYCTNTTTISNHNNIHNINNNINNNNNNDEQDNRNNLFQRYIVHLEAPPVPNHFHGIPCGNFFP